MAIGGFNGTDPAPTLAQFERGWPRAGSTTSSPGAAWAAGGGGTSNRHRDVGHSHFSSTTVGGVTLYDLTAPAGSST